MDESPVETAPMIQGFTPVNRPSVEAELMHNASATPSPNRKRKANAGTKPREFHTIENKRCKRSHFSKPETTRTEIATTPSIRNAKASNASRSQDSRDVSKGLRLKKPGLSGGAVPEKMVTLVNPQTAYLIDSGTVPYAIKDAENTTKAAQSAQPRSKSLPQGVNRTSQSPYVAQATDQADGGRENVSWASSVTLMESFETMMDRLVDHKAFFRKLDVRPKKSIGQGDSQSDSNVHGDLPAPIETQLAELTSSHTEQAQDEYAPSEGESFFDEALEKYDFVVSRQSPNSASTADVQNKTNIHSKRVQKPFQSSLAEVASTSAERIFETSNVESERACEKVDEVDEFPIDDDEFPLLEEGDWLQDDGYREKRVHHDKSGFQICYDDVSVALDPFADEDLDAELLNMSTASPPRNYGGSPPYTQCSPKEPKLQWTPPIQYTQVKLTDMSKKYARGSSPATLVRAALSSKSGNSAPHRISFSEDGKPSPFVRPSFPAALLPRSPITGLAPNTMLRTCFRIGEALNAASVALRNSKDAIVELYCRVKYSDRESNGYKQFFELADLFAPEKPPFLNGVYSIWKGVSLWEYDSKAFLGERARGKLARVMGRIKRGEANKGWEMTIINVWEATWDDVGIVKGVIFS